MATSDIFTKIYDISQNNYYNLFYWRDYFIGQFEYGEQIERKRVKSYYDDLLGREASSLTLVQLEVTLKMYNTNFLQKIY